MTPLPSRRAALAAAFGLAGGSLVAAMTAVFLIFGREIVKYAYARTLVAALAAVAYPLGATSLVHAAVTARGGPVGGRPSLALGALGLAAAAVAAVPVASALSLYSDYLVPDVGAAGAAAAAVLVVGGEALLLGTGAGVLASSFRSGGGRDEAAWNRRYTTLRKWQATGLLALVVLAGVPAALLASGPRCYGGSCLGFSDPAWDLPEGPHYNAALDDPVRVNQTLLAATEKALRALTTIRQAGGFPMRVTPDGCTWAGDRGFGCPYFPGEFSIQGGTPLLAGLFLDFYAVEPDPRYLRVATEAADALLAVQDSESGGFYYDGRRRPDGTGYQPHPLNSRRATILDDHVTQDALDFLLDVYLVTGNETYREALWRGFDCLDAMEKPGGGWPQRSNYPADAYESLVTLNDDALREVVFLLLKAHAAFPGDSRFLAAAERAGLFLKRVQGAGGAPYQAGWAQQYDDDDQPAWARSFEPPAICSKQTVSAMECLLELYLVTGNASWLEPIPAGVAWLRMDNTTVGVDEDGNPVYARLYELGTNRPIYGVDGGKWSDVKYVYDLSQAREGYSWQGGYGVRGFLERWDLLVSLGYDRAAYSTQVNAPRSLASALGRALEAVTSQTPDGFWLDEQGNVRDSECASALSKLVEYLELASV
ncbi:MAG: hypothetical protein Kow0069_20010 [Promethearchaeota archaeon]